MTWRPTHAQIRVVAAAAGLLVVAVLARRPDAAVLGLPLAFLAVWGRYFRPREQPEVHTELDAPVLFEGQATTYRLRVTGTLDPDIDLVVAALPRSRWFRYDPPQAAVAEPASSGTVSLEVGVRSERWGLRQLERPLVIATSVLGAYRMQAASAGAVSVTTLPLREGFEAVDAVPRPAGLVGLHRSRRPGEGTEIAGVRPFRTGDRLRRINWSVSARTRELHVTSTWSDRDTEVVILLDTGQEVGISEGIDGRSSSLDTAVRAAASIAEHYLRHGDRVRLVDTGTVIRGVRAGSGRAHLRRILDVLVHADRKGRQQDEVQLARRHRVRADSLVLVLSPLLRQSMLGYIVTLVHSGCTVIAVDTLPEEVADVIDLEQHDPRAWPLAWRLRLLERRSELDRLGDLGVPTVRWRGAGTLDEVLRDAARVSAAPRMRS
ncbi:uncharacterized protein (DUF58 family) [Kribbella sp. VKM Ac-2527]|uniref:Uncharacterized protein (DUF58 family) n=1 Tax=Kribbella caucasensis TaxID=2512215 RepID=A0A4R6K6G8_9ACTN|nr:DUF58 domain-containing protein [Kribbella sp. VKM Ac-2527]TDO44142.1 uncharacterized protein (DUF58 family) [Kribbella sp. VKM Ac-2527]